MTPSPGREVNLTVSTTSELVQILEVSSAPDTKLLGLCAACGEPEGLHSLVNFRIGGWLYFRQQ